MAIQRVKTKIMLSGIGIICFIMILSGLIVSYFIFEQNRDNSFQLLHQSMNITKDTIVDIENKLYMQSQQAAAANDLGLNLDWANTTSFDDGQLLGMESTLKTIMKGINNISLAGSIWRMSVYKMDRSLLGFVTNNEQSQMLGLLRTDDFLVAEVKPGEPILEETWKARETVEGIQAVWPEDLPEKEKTAFRIVDGHLCLTMQIPVVASVIDSESGNVKEAQVGMIHSIHRFDETFISNLEKTTGNAFGIVKPDGSFEGLMDGYQAFQVANLDKPSEIGSISSQSVTMNTTSVGEDVYFQAILPIYSENSFRGAVVALYSREQAMKNTWKIITILAVVSIGCVLLFIPVSLLFSNSLSKPLENLASVLTMVEESGDFSRRVQIGKQDEVGRTSLAFNKLMEMIQRAIDEVNGVMEQVSKGNLSSEINTDYKGDLGKLKDHTNNSIRMLAQLIGQVRSASESVNHGAVELTSSSQTLANGTTQQAATLEEISSSMDEIEQRTRNNSDSASAAQHITQQSMQVAQKGNQQMESMLASMQRINKTSHEVSKVIKVIDEIAFQTNLLALNAAVEAARAGKFGKGFAVVAEEVRNLAARSAEAAKNTTELIQSSLGEVQKGVQNADSTAEILTEIISSVEKSDGLISEISKASEEQTESVKEINNGLTNVNHVIQQNSSISEQTASASEQLSKHAAQLQQLMDGFQLIQEVSLLADDGLEDGGVGSLLEHYD